MYISLLTITLSGLKYKYLGLHEYQPYLIKMTSSMPPKNKAILNLALPYYSTRDKGVIYINNISRYRQKCT
jgi:hypothetical protein